MISFSTVQAIKWSLPGVIDKKKVAAARAGLPAEEVIHDAVEVFKALANSTRLRMMHALAHDELCVGDLAHALGVSMSAVSHQLALLRRLKLVTWRDEGRQTYYRASDEFVGHLVHDCLVHTGAPHHHKHRLPSKRRR